MTPSERRAFRRFPVMVHVAKPVEIRLDGAVEGLPGVLVDLSAGGMSLVTFTSPAGMPPHPSAPLRAGLQPLPQTSRYTFCLNLAGTHRFQLPGRIIRAQRKGETYLVGIKFSAVHADWRQRLQQLADAYLDCEEKLAVGKQHVCFPECAYYALCEKSAKEPFGVPQP